MFVTKRLQSCTCVEPFYSNLLNGQLTKENSDGGSHLEQKEENDAKKKRRQEKLSISWRRCAGGLVPRENKKWRQCVNKQWTINNQHDFASKVLRSPTGACYGMMRYFFAFLTVPSKLTVVFGKHCSSKRSPLISDKQWGQNCPLIMLLPLLLLQLSGFLPIQGFTDCSVGSQPCWFFFVAKITCRSFFWAVAVVTTMPRLSNSTLGLRTNVL